MTALRQLALREARCLRKLLPKMGANLSKVLNVEITEGLQGSKKSLKSHAKSCSVYSVLQRDGGREKGREREESTPKAFSGFSKIQKGQATLIRTFFESDISGQMQDTEAPETSLVEFVPSTEPGYREMATAVSGLDLHRPN